MNKALERIKNYVKKTPLLTSKKLNEELGAEIFFKMENQQVTNSFKARGAFNAVLSYKERHGKFPEKIVVQSSGNHAQAAAYVGKTFGIPVLVYMITKASPLKIKAVRDLGAEVVLLEKRSDVNRAAHEKQKEGYVLIHPSADADIIAGQATSALEALSEIGEVDLIFAPCGGGGLIAGSFLAAQSLSPKAKVLACEPANANDVARSFRAGEILSFDDTPDTIADGARTLATSEICFHYIKQLAGVLEISEEEILHWQQRLTTELNPTPSSELPHSRYLSQDYEGSTLRFRSSPYDGYAVGAVLGSSLHNPGLAQDWGNSDNGVGLKQKIEPTSALAIAGVKQYLQKNPPAKKPRILVIISGGNVD
ncbi:MAG: pyridoxal-phosphate dependent enzyme [Alphaproteobacteria bacterium]|nr:pyridoxal-phosphate dependent enzyme [Alphaproteobacteria bacterium]